MLGACSRSPESQIERLGARDPLEVAAGVHQLERMGSEAFEPLARCAEGESRLAVGQTCLGVLVARKDPQLVPRLIAIIDAGGPAFCRAAVALTTMVRAEALPHPQILRAATHCTWAGGYVRLRPALPDSPPLALAVGKELLEQRAVPGVRTRGVEVLITIRSPAAIPPLIGVLDDADTSVRDAAIDALGELGHLDLSKLASAANAASEPLADSAVLALSLVYRRTGTTQALAATQTGLERTRTLERAVALACRVGNPQLRWSREVDRPWGSSFAKAGTGDEIDRLVDASFDVYGKRQMRGRMLQTEGMNRLLNSGCEGLVRRWARRHGFTVGVK